MFGSVKSFVRKRFRAAFMDGRRFTRMRSGDVFAYNRRGEVASAVIAGQTESHVYDFIGNSVTSAVSSADSPSAAVTNVYAANSLNQYESILTRANWSSWTEDPSYDANGDFTFGGDFGYSYDALSRLTGDIKRIEVK